MENRKLIIPGDLSCPPSEVYTFRTFTFFAHRFCEYDVLVTIPWEFRDTYWRWFKDNYLFDHVKDLVEDSTDIQAVKISLSRLTCENLQPCLKSIGFNMLGMLNKR